MERELLPIGGCTEKDCDPLSPSPASFGNALFTQAMFSFRHIFTVHTDSEVLQLSAQRTCFGCERVQLTVNVLNLNDVPQGPQRLACNYRGAIAHGTSLLDDDQGVLFMFS